MMLPLAWEATLGVAGLCLGSFAVTAGLRTARAEPFLAGRSHCDACGATLGYWRTVPLVAYATQRCACAACGERIEPLHPLGELAGAAIVMAPFLVASPTRAALVATLGLMLLAASVVDLKTLRLPDGLTLAIAATASVLSLLRGWDAVWFGLGAAVVTLGLLLAVRVAAMRLRDEPGLGLGDVKLAAALALWLGLATPWAIGAAALLGLGAAAVGRLKGRFAFGPALAAGAFAVGLTQEALGWPL